MSIVTCMYNMYTIYDIILGHVAAEVKGDSKESTEVPPNGTIGECVLWHIKILLWKKSLHIHVIIFSCVRSNECAFVIVVCGVPGPMK